MLLCSLCRYNKAKNISIAPYRTLYKSLYKHIKVTKVNNQKRIYEKLDESNIVQPTGHLQRMPQVCST